MPLRRAAADAMVTSASLEFEEALVEVFLGAPDRGCPKG